MGPVSEMFTVSTVENRLYFLEDTAEDLIDINVWLDRYTRVR